MIPNDVDALVRQVVDIHFDDNTGSPYWINKKSELSFNPTEDIQSIEDLNLFYDDDAYDLFPVDKMKEEPRRFIPKKFDGSEDWWYSTGGRTGKPKWTIWTQGDWDQVLDIGDDICNRHGITNRDWLYLGPTGPHVFGYWAHEMPQRHNGRCLMIDLDPRWIRKSKTTPELRQHNIGDEYLNHLQAQTQDLMEAHAQNIGVLVSTPSVIGMLAEQGALDRLNLDLVIFAGQSIKPENYLALDNQLDCPILGIYGNTLFGTIYQNGYKDEIGVTYPEISWSAKLTVLSDVDSLEQAEYGERGRILTHIFREGLFAPVHLEDDAATSLPPEDDDVARIGQPDVPTANEADIEPGVY